MQRRTLGKTGLQVSVLGFGGAPIGFVEADQGQVTTLLNALLDRGVNLVDTAAMYMGSEEAIGKAISHRRSEFVLVTKCGGSTGAAAESWSGREIERSVERALNRLRTDHLDVMLLHSCDLETLRRGEALSALVRAREAGKIRFAGYSGDGAAASYATRLPDVAVIEVSINICDQANIESVLPVAVAANLGVIAKRPIANSAWKDLSEQRGIYASYARTYTERLAAMKIAPADLGWVGDPRQVWPEIALRFTLSQQGVHSAIIGTSNLAHAEANIRAAEMEPLPPAVLEKIRQAFLRAESASGATWDAQT